MNKKAIKFLFKKEILDVLRDKKTVLMMLIVPLVVYPLMMLLSMQMMTKITQSLEHNTYRIAFDFQDDADGKYANIFKDAGKDEEGLELVQVENVSQALTDESIDAYISLDKSNGKEEFTIHYMSSVTNSDYSVNIIQDMLRKYADKLTESRIKDANLDVDYILKPIEVEYKDSSSKEQSAGNMLGMLLPFMLVVSLLMGTMYPAIDTTAGEKERGTMETLLTLPVTSKELIVSKFLTVAVIGIVSAVLNIISMCGVGVYMYKVAQIASDSEKVDMSRFVPVIVVGALCILAFAVFISAITMCVCAFAKSYKEANNYITPLMLVVMFASFIAFIPNVELDVSLALVPVANICLLLKNLLVFKYNASIIAVVLISNIAYGIIAVSLLAKIYNSEAILFGDGSAGVQIFERRSNLKKGGVPTPGDAWLVISVTAVLIIYAGSMLQLKYGLYGVGLTQLIIIGIPLMAAIYTKKDLFKTFKLKPCSPVFFVGGIFLSIGALLIGIIISTVVGKIFPSSFEGAAETMDILGGHGFVVSLIIIALAPAICEEFLFRGYIFSAMNSKMKTTSAILISSALFGVYHMSVVKFFTTAILGAIICYATSASKCIFVGSLMHFINNATSCVVSFYPYKVGRVFPILVKEVPEFSDYVIFAVCGVVFLTIGGLIINYQKKKVEKNEI